jgi:hypothetical protein
MLFFALTVALSAFLLFEVQPVIAKMILPWFGGSSAVWSTCMLFFQLVLLLGYLYAHLLNRLPPRRQAFVHITLLAVAVLTLPVVPNQSWKQAGLSHPSLTILELLAVTAGVPYFLLSSTSPLLQAWYARTQKSGMPYRLFALSNAASLLALLSYPFLIEPALPSHQQAIIWSAAFAVYALLCALTAWRNCVTMTSTATGGVLAMEADSPEPPSWIQRVLWLGLSASASILLLAVTTHLTQDVAAIPFLWIAPLVAYLLSFILCFESQRFYHRAVFVPLLAASLAFMAYRLWPEHAKMDLRTVILFLITALFICCMACHGELVRLKPHPRYLTGFYVTISVGGAVGGLFVGLFAPNVFHAYYEFPIGLAFCALVVTLAFTRELWSASYVRRSTCLVVLSVMLGAYLLFLRDIMVRMVDGYLVVTRNFYGQLRVEDDGDPRIDDDAARKLIHGVINHGQQMLSLEYRREPVSYFCPQSGIGRAMAAQEGHPRRIGILGLGCGTLAAYGRAGDTLRIYEINPKVLEIAKRDFTYLQDTAARVEVALGDGRLVLESEPVQRFEMLVMDAFSGDSVPVHLITREAFATYFRHLKPDGILAVNISNTYLDLEPVMERAANAFGKVALVYHWTPPPEDPLCFSCSWTLIMDSATLDAHPGLRDRAAILHQKRPFRIWTDDFSNMLSILK